MKGSGLKREASRLTEPGMADQIRPFRCVVSHRCSSRSCDPNILRSAAILEQTFGGLTTNLWDDPFEWTLPETLNNQERIIEYLAEVDATRERAFCCFSDDALTKYVSSPAGEFVLLSVLLDALVRASDYHGRAAATSKMFSDGSTVRFII